MQNVLKKSFFTGILDNWKKDMKENKLVFWLEMIGTLGCMIAAGSLALTAPHPNLLLVYGAYMTGSSTLMVSSYLRNNGFWVILNGFFFAVDVVGLHNTLTA
jgi:hypothetical protein